MQIKILFYLLFSLAVFQSNAQHKKIIEGFVYDEHGEGLVGAIIQVENKPIGTVTDWDGKFRLEINAGQITDDKFNIVISMIGYEKQIIRIDMQTSLSTLKITLKELVIEPIPLPDYRYYKKQALYKDVKPGQPIMFEYAVEHSFWYDYKFNGGE